MAKFKVGDKIKTTDNIGGVSISKCPIGSVGTIVKYDHSDNTYLVAFDLGEWWVNDTDVKLISDETPKRKDDFTTKFKVGDKVRVKSREWYEANKNPLGFVDVKECFMKEMVEFCGKVLTIKDVLRFNCYYTEETHWVFSDEMLEDEPVKVDVCTRPLVKVNIPDSMRKLYDSIVGHHTISTAKVPLISKSTLLTHITLD